GRAGVRWFGVEWGRGLLALQLVGDPPGDPKPDSETGAQSGAATFTGKLIASRTGPRPGWHCSHGKRLDEDKPGNEAADVRAIGDSPCLGAGPEGAQAADDLESKPQADGDVGGYLGQDAKHDHRNALSREHQNIAPQNPRNRPGGAQRRHQRIAAKG